MEGCSVVDGVPLEKRGRGRPIVTGLGVDLEKKKAAAALQKREKERQDLERDIELLISRSKFEAERAAGPGKIGRDKDDPEVIKIMTTVDIAAGVGESLGVITEVAKRASGLQGRLQGSLNRAVENMQMALSTIITRLAGAETEEGPDSLAGQVRAMREELGVLRSQNGDLRAEVEALRAARSSAPSSLPPPGKTKSFAEVAKSPTIGREWPNQAFPHLPQREKRPRKAAEKRVPQPPTSDSEEMGEGAGAMIFDDLLPEDAPPPSQVRQTQEAWRPPILGVAAPLGTYVPNLSEADRLEYDLITGDMLSLVEAMAVCRNDEVAHGAICAALQARAKDRAAVEARAAGTPYKRWNTPAPPNPLTRPPPAPMGPIPRVRQPAGGTQEGERQKKKKKKRKKKAVPPEGPAPNSVANKAATKGKESKGGTTVPPPPAAPQSPAGAGTGWVEVGRGGRRLSGVGKTAPPQSGLARAVATAPPPLRGSRIPPPNKGPKSAPPNGGKKKGKPKAPRSAAVLVACPEGEQAAFMKTARERISLADIGIEGSLKARRALTGALLLEVPGADAGPKADALVDRLLAIAAEKGEGYLVRRPIKTATLRIRGVECSLSAEEVAAAIAEKGGCRPTDVSVGQSQQAPRGVSTLLVRCPLTAAIKVAAAERIQLGWVRVGVELLTSRPLFCYRCLEQGHVRGSCRSSEDRSSCCYRCGDPGHRAAGCTKAPRCLVCEAAGRPSGHKLGGQACRPPSKSAIRRRRRAAAKEVQKGGEKEAPRPKTKGVSPGAGAVSPPPSTSAMDVEAVLAVSTEGADGRDTNAQPTPSMDTERLEGRDT